MRLLRLSVEQMMLKYHRRILWRIPAIFSMAVFSISCSICAKHGIPLTSSKILDSVQTYVDSTNSKTVVLVPMLHIAKASDYDRIADYLDTLKSQGFVTFCEGLLVTDKYSDSLSIPLCRDLKMIYSPNDSMRLDTLQRKMRKILGHNLVSKYDGMASRRGMVVQTRSALNLNGDRDYWVDVTYADAIKEFEVRFGEIVLSEYDYECPLDSDDYKGKKDKRFSCLRENKNKCNEKLGKCVVGSGFDKIAVVFGYAHMHYLKLHVLLSNGYELTTNSYKK